MDRLSAQRQAGGVGTGQCAIRLPPAPLQAQDHGRGRRTGRAGGDPAQLRRRDAGHYSTAGEEGKVGPEFKRPRIQEARNGGEGNGGIGPVLGRDLWVAAVLGFGFFNQADYTSDGMKALEAGKYADAVVAFGKAAAADPK